VKQGVGGRTAYELADTFCRAARRRVEVLFAGIGSNDDPLNYATARAVLAGRYTWLEQGVVHAPVVGPDVAESQRTVAAAGS
jgi:hypothetical protein